MVVGGWVGVGLSTHLGRDDQVVALPPVLLDGLTHDLLRLAVRVPLGAVEKVDPAVVRRLHALVRALAVDVPAVREPPAERDGRHLQPGPAQEAVLHLGKVVWLGHGVCVLAGVRVGRCDVVMARTESQVKQEVDAGQISTYLYVPVGRYFINPSSSLIDLPQPAAASGDAESVTPACMLHGCTAAALRGGRACPRRYPSAGSPFPATITAPLASGAESDLTFRRWRD